jgi:hypothetical protein
VGSEDAVDRAVDKVRPGTRGQADGEPDVGVSQGSGLQALEDRVPGEVDHLASLPSDLPDRHQRIDESCGQSLSPNNARPMRTIVAPSSTATG